MAIDKIARKYGSIVERSSVGEINVVNKMKKINSQLGGEGNGGVILPESHYGRDSLVASTLILDFMSKEKKTISEIFNLMPQYKIYKDKVRISSNQNMLFFYKNIKKLFSDADLNTKDGIKFQWSNSWVHIRQSNTEPIIRIYSEAKSSKEAKSLIQEVKSLLNDN